MGRVFKNIFLLITGVLILSCTKEVLPELSLSLGKVTLPSDGTLSTVTITTNQSWSYEVDKDWITVTQTDNILTISAEPNNTTTPRTANIRITVGTGSNALVEMITVIQQGATPSVLSLSTKSLTLSQLGLALPVAVTTNQPSWSSSKSESWLSVSSDGNTILIGATANTSTSARTGNVSVVVGPLGNQVTETIVVTQSGAIPIPTLSLSANSFSLTNEVATRTVTVTTNQSTWSFSADKNWISVARDGNTLTIVSEKNISATSRTAIITVSTGEGANKITETILINQQGSASATINVTNSNVSLDYTGVGVNVTVTTNQPSWSFEKSKEWILVTSVGSTLSISANPNSSISSRSGKITITAGPVENQTTITILVTQGGVPKASLTLSESTISFFQKSATASLTITTNQPVWNFTVSDSWATVIREGNTLTISAPENIYPYVRSSQVTVTAGEGENTITQTISVTQQGDAPAWVSVSTNSVLLAYDGTSTVTASVTSNQPLGFTVSQSWILVSLNGGVLTITAAPNPNKIKRTGTVTINAGFFFNYASAVINVEQDPKPEPGGAGSGGYKKLF